MNYNFCIGNPHDGSVVKEFNSRKEREAYIKYLHTLPDQEFMNFWGYMCRATCRPGDDFVLNFQGDL